MCERERERERERARERESMFERVSGALTTLPKAAFRKDDALDKPSFKDEREWGCVRERERDITTP